MSKPEKESPFDKSPEETANIYSILFYTWLNPLLKTGYHQPLEIPLLYPLSQQHLAHVIYNKVKNSWELYKANKHLHSQKMLLLKSLYHCFKSDFIISGICRVLGDLLIVFSPYIMNIFIQSLQDKSSPLWEGYILALVLFLIQIFQSILLNVCFAKSMQIGVWLRTGLIQMIFNHSLQMSGASRQMFPSGKLLNIMSTDITRLDFAMQFIHYLWAAPFQLLIAFVLLLVQVGVSALLGLFILVLSVPFQYKASEIMTRQRLKLSALSDERVKWIQEALMGMRVVKYYVWETFFMSQIEKVREKELKSLRWILGMRASTAGFLQTVPILSCIATLILYNHLNPGQLTTAKAFTCLAYFYVLRIPLLIYPTVLAQTSDSWIALQRITQVLLSETQTITWRSPLSSEVENVIEVKNATFGWFKDTPILKNLSFTIPKGALVGIIGSVGSGKSSLLHALIGDLYLLEGDIKLKGSIAISTQQSFIQNKTLRENILFDQPMNQEKYRDTLACSSLEGDLKVLVGGDETEIGENGVNLSGGQKSRVSLARAIYADTDLIFLDDPLSAVDAHVGTHIFEQAILNRLKNRTRFLVTHRLHVLSSCDYILFMDKGEIIAQGTYQELVESKNEKFMELIKELENLPKEEKKKITEVKNTEPSQKPTGTEEQKKLTILEDRSRGQVTWKVYTDYIKMGGGWFVFSVVLFLLAASQVVRIINDGWLTIWIQDQLHWHNTIRYEMVYLGLGLIQAFVFVLTGLGFCFMAVIAARNIHQSALQKVFESPMLWFDQQPLGRILNRFSRDVDTVDSLLSEAVRVFAFTFSMTMSILILLCVITPYFVIPLVPTLFVYYYIQYYYRKSSVELKRLDLMTRSPLNAHFSSSLSPMGLSTIRAFDRNKEFEDSCYLLLDQNNRPYYLSVLAQRWMAIRLECLAGGVVGWIGLLGQLLKNVLEPSWIALGLTYSLQVTFVFNWCIKQAAEMEMYLASVERLCYYIDHLESEDDYLSRLEKKGRIEMEEYEKKQKQLALEKIKLEPVEEVDNEEQSTLEQTEEPIVHEISKENKDVDQHVDESKVDEEVDQNNYLVEVDLSDQEMGPVEAILSDQKDEHTEAKISDQENELDEPKLSEQNNDENVVDDKKVDDLLIVDGQKQEVQVEEQKEEIKPEPKVKIVKPENKDYLLEWKDVCMRYRVDLPLVLDHVSFPVARGTKVGIVGRTGAGKSSLIQALFRLTPLCKGQIIFNGQSADQLPLSAFRKQISIIPQDPVLFGGTIRQNIDPLGVYSEKELIKSIQDLGLFASMQHLKQNQKLENSYENLSKKHKHEKEHTVIEMNALLTPEKCLDFWVEEGGQNLSKGQCQLICLIRAVLKRSELIVLDEATASVDEKLDQLIQKVIRQLDYEIEGQLKKVTVLTIAHRLGTIMDYDTIIVMKQGSVIEMGSPDDLIEQRGIFYSMAKEQKVI